MGSQMSHLTSKMVEIWKVIKSRFIVFRFGEPIDYKNGD